MPEKDLRILVVDDFATMRRMIKNILKQLGYTHIEEADNGQAAWSLLETREIDLVISDWNMPTMTGLELLKAVRSDERFKDLPFIMVTAEGQQENVIEAAQNKVSQYVVKPFNADTIAGKIESVI
ncbi:MAG: response regulator [Proteobacteria bacterium]|nr:response regulator [Pseudomonadota bacterium]